MQVTSLYLSLRSVPTIYLWNVTESTQCNKITLFIDRSLLKYSHRKKNRFRSHFSCNLISHKYSKPCQDERRFDNQYLVSHGLRPKYSLKEILPPRNRASSNWQLSRCIEQHRLVSIVQRKIFMSSFTTAAPFWTQRNLWLQGISFSKDFGY